jgi:hypothetical protein
MGKNPKRENFGEIIFTLRPLNRSPAANSDRSSPQHTSTFSRQIHLPINMVAPTSYVIIYSNFVPSMGQKSKNNFSKIFTLGAFAHF